MSMKNLLSRLRKLGPRLHVPPEECPRPQVGAIVWDGGPEPAEEDVVPCSNCNGSHMLCIEEIIVEPAKPFAPA
jgi:hypothetical protein